VALYEHKGVRPVLGRGVFIAPGASVLGDVHLGDESSVWFSSVLRGDSFPIRIGARTNIQDGSVVHITGGKAATRVGDDVTVGHMVLLHGCTVGDRCLIGMGSVILDGAVIGDECIIAAGSLIAPRTVIPPRSMVMGRPGKPTRVLTDDDLKMVLEAGRVYVESAQTFLSDAVERID
jgi:carbonic anhydrase/acetyltransferase-like protein (isoleucine patch superfamily)